MATKRTVNLGDLFMGSAPKSGFEALGRSIGGGDAYKALAQQQAEDQLGDRMVKEASARKDSADAALSEDRLTAIHDLPTAVHAARAAGLVPAGMTDEAVATVIRAAASSTPESIAGAFGKLASEGRLGDAVSAYDSGDTQRSNMLLRAAGQTPVDYTKESGGTFYNPNLALDDPHFHAVPTPVGTANITQSLASAFGSKASGQAALENAATNRGELDLRRSLPQSDVGKVNWDFRHGGMDQPTYQAATAKATALPKGVSITGYDDQGRPLISVGGSGMGTQAQNQLELRQINSTEQLGRIDQIAKAFDPDYLNIGTKAGIKWAELKDKAGVGLDPQTSQKLRGYVVFKRRAADNLNTIVHDLSGAAVTPQEAQRLTQAIPTPGNGLFDGDSPTEFKAKLDDVTRQLKLAIARTNYARAKGINRFSMTLGDMENAINQRGVELEQQVRQENPNAAPELVQSQVDARLGSEFGLQP